MSETEEGKKSYVDGAEIRIVKVSVRQNFKKEEVVDKITFETNKGDVTYKPKTERKEFRNGIEFVKLDKITESEMPGIVSQIALLCKTNGFCNVKVHYSVWETIADGEPVTYRFVNGAKMFEKWEIVPFEEGTASAKEENVK